MRVTASEGIPREQVRRARERLESLRRYTSRPLTDARLTLRRASRSSKQACVADASMGVDGRTVAAHAAGPTALEAAEAVVDRLRRQLRRVVEADVALRNDPRVIRAALADLDHRRGDRPEKRTKPPEQREIVHRRPYLDTPLSTLEAVNELLDLDAEFFLFRHVRTGEDVVVRRRDGGVVGLLFPPGSDLADEDDVVAPEPSRYSSPLTLDAARREMDELDHRFLYFIDAEDGRGKVLYLRHDGDYGLVEPAVIDDAK